MAWLTVLLVLLSVVTSVEPLAGQPETEWARDFGAPGINGGVADIAQKGDSLVVVGSFSAAGDMQAQNVVLFSLTTREWSRLGTGVAGEVSAVAIGDVGEVYVGGLFSGVGGVEVNNVAVWDGSSWLSLGSGLNGRAWDLAFGNGLLYVVGDFSQAGDSPANSVVQWDGSEWSALGEGASDGIPSGSVYTLALDSDGGLYVGGRFQEAGGLPATSLAVWDGSDWRPVAQELSSTEGTGVVVFALEWQNGELLVGGDFTHAGPEEVNNIARLADGKWQALGNGLPETIVESISTAPNGEVHVAANFVSDGALNSMASFSDGRWNFVERLRQRPSRVVHVVDTSRVVVGHQAIFVPSEGQSNPAQFLFEWSLVHEEWSVLDGNAKGLDGPVYTLTSDMKGGFYAGGSFQFAGQTRADDIAQWNGAEWRPLGNGLSGRVLATVVSPNGDVYAGGEFRRSGDHEIAYVGRWDGVEWLPLDVGISFPELPGLEAVHTLQLVGDTLYVGGVFTMAGSVSSPFLALWDLGTEQWLVPPANPNGAVYSMVAAPSGLLYVGGLFDAIGSETAFNNVAVWDGSSWHKLGEGSGGPVTALALDGDQLLAAGSFGDVYGVARWDGSGWHTLGEIPFEDVSFGQINALTTAPGIVFAAGGFKGVLGPDGHPLAANRIAALKEAGWIQLDGIGVGGGSVRSLLVVGNDLYVGGDFYFAAQDVDDTVLEPGDGIPSVGLAAYLNATALPNEAYAPELSERELSIYPNPVTTGGSLQLVFEQVGYGPATLFVWDVLGRIVRRIELGWREVGRHHITISDLPLSAGSYFVELTTPRSRRHRLVTIGK